METKLVKVPFDVELAKKITEKSVDGRIVTRRGDNVRIVCWNYKSMSGDYPILALVDEKSQEEVIPYSECGRYNVHGYFSEDCLDLMLKIPEYMTFKDGDVMVSNDGSFMFLLSTKGKCKTSLYASVRDGKLLRVCDVEEGFAANGDRIDLYHRGSDKQVRIFINLLKSSKEPKAKEYLKRFFDIEVKSECEFKPFDKVLVRESDDDIWDADIFSRQGQYGSYICIGGLKEYCIPYNENTAHLLGTTEDYKEE